MRKKIHNLCLGILLLAFCICLLTANLLEESQSDSQKPWQEYSEMEQAIWEDVKYFPVPEFTSDPTLTVSYENSWMAERTYGGKRGHEGTDIMAAKNERGLYPIVSMTDGVVTKKGWLEKGGYRIGIVSPNGVYFYYAHLDSYADIEVGDEVKAGDILGYMGDSGYGPEGTVGQFAVHLHLGIYIYPNGEETSVNPYWILRYIENRKVKCYTKM
ncbi:MAG: M23 family metallopeptidase [Tyzzerella sp.]|nr:M23 family metallopeptidase [Tyzzerella sp.]